MTSLLFAVLIPAAAFLALAYAEQFARGFNGIVYAVTPRRRRSEPDWEQVAIDRLYSLGTERGASLAAEIERGRTRRETDA